MKRVEQTRDELLGHLKTQIRFLELSAESYDAGFEDEAKRLAVVIRVLVHDTSKSTSLLTLLNKKSIQFYDSSLPYRPNSLLPYNGLTMIKMSAGEGSYVAPLDGGAPTRSRVTKASFNVWWKGKFVIRDRNKKTFTRSDLVLSVANADGGAHVDPKLDEDYASLSRFNSLGWKVFSRDIEDDFKNSPVLPSIRQIAHEVVKTLKEEFSELL